MTKANRTKMNITKIAVLLGGTSAERAVSLKSGAAVLSALQRAGFNAEAIDPSIDSIFNLKEQGFSHVFIAMHGRGGEDGIVQAILTYQQIPYTGSKVLASALAMSKSKTKQIWQNLDLPLAKSCLIEKTETLDLRQIEAEIGFPLFIKPSNEGSSVGMSKVLRFEDLEGAIKQAFEYDDVIMAEAFLAGKEYTVAILGDKALPSICIQTNAQFYDYNAKYLSNETCYFCPSGLDEKQEQEIQALALKAYQAIGCSGWGRVDLMCDAVGKFHLLEVNTAPGMTDHSLVPMAAKAAGITFEELVTYIIQSASY